MASSLDRLCERRHNQRMSPSTGFLGSAQRLLLATVLLMHAAPAQAVGIVLNNGLAPPNPENVLDITTGTFDVFFLRNADCPPEPAVTYGDPCPAPAARRPPSCRMGLSSHS
jgi:hypothetical protein